MTEMKVSNKGIFCKSENVLLWLISKEAIFWLINLKIDFSDSSKEL